MNKQKNIWTEEEDVALSMLYQQRHIQDWNEIAKILNEQFNFSKKNPKQYKQRYMNHLSNALFKIQWSQQEEKLFLKLHNEIGNKWASIAQHLMGKTDNCVKNHFYSKLRKLLRKLNKIIQFFLKKQFRPIDISIMYKIVQAAQERFKQKPNCQQSVSLECLGVQNQMLEFAMFKDINEGQQEQQLKYTPSKIQQYKQLIKEIYRVSKLYKRKSKKVRNSLIQAPVNHSKKKTKKQTIKLEQYENEQKQYEYRQKIPTTILVNKNNSQQQSSDQDVKEEAQQNDFQSQSIIQQKKQRNKRNSLPNGRIQVQQGQGIQQLLRIAGILHDQIKIDPPTKGKNSRKYSNSQYNASIANPLANSPNLTSQTQPMNFVGNSSSAQYSPLHSFSSQQVQNFLGFPMINNPNVNGYVNFTLSQKSSFKSYSEIDPSEIQNPFFDYQSSNNARMMFPMNFNLPETNQYQQSYSQNPSFTNFPYPNIYYSQQPQGEGQSQQNQQNQQR